MAADRSLSKHPAPPAGTPGAGGTLRDALRAVASLLPGGGEDRPGQLAMAEAVDRAISQRRHLVAQAGTGTGKTLAYLLPAIRSGATVVVSTATRALQDQLAGSDLPQISRALAGVLPVRFAVLKGRTNYLCRQRAAEVAGRTSWRSAAGEARLDRLAQPGGAHGGPLGGPTGDDATVASERPWVAAPIANALPGLGEYPASAFAGPGPWPPDPMARLDPPPDGATPGHAAGTGTGHATGTTGGTTGATTGQATAVATATVHGASGRPGMAMAGDYPQPAPDRMVDELRQILDWAETSPSGDRAELSFEPQPRTWALVSVGPRECPGAFRCPSGDDCFAELARARAAAAQVVVVNTALTTAHLASGGAVLPEHDIIVIDEAHEAEDIVSHGLGVELTPGRLRAAAAAARGLLGPGADPVAPVSASADQLEAALAASAERRIDLAGERALADLLVVARGRVDDLARALRSAGDDGTGPEGARRARALLATGNLAGDLAIALEGDPDRVLWIGSTGRSRSLRSTPIDVGPILAARLWPEVTAILASATMPPGVADRLGLPSGRTDHIDVGSPFPYRENALLYVPPGIPDRRTSGADGKAYDELVDLMLAAGGRTLALFTSWRAMSDAHGAVAPRVPFPVLTQGERPKAQLLSAFAGDEATCLFATLSFWQGVDVPGRTASLVVIDRLPFPRPDDPLLQARRERAGPGAFHTIDIPRAATLLAQGAGRLVRRSSDQGVVAVLDPRLATAGYRRALLSAMPPMRRTVTRDEVHAFLRSLASTGDEPGDPPATSAAERS